MQPDHTERHPPTTDNTATSFSREHQAYQYALKQQIILKHALDDDRFDDFLTSLYRDIQNAHSEKAPSPGQVASMMITLLPVAPEQHFPDIAKSIELAAATMPIEDLTRKIRTYENPEIKKASKDQLINLALNETFRRSLQYDRLHEETFGPDAKDGSYLTERLDRWLHAGSAKSPSLKKYAAWGGNLGFLLAGAATGALAGVGTSMAVRYGLPKAKKTLGECYNRIKQLLSRLGIAKDINRFNDEGTRQLSSSLTSRALVTLAMCGAVAGSLTLITANPGLDQYVNQYADQLKDLAEQTLKQVSTSLQATDFQWSAGPWGSSETLDTSSAVSSDAPANDKNSKSVIGTWAITTIITAWVLSAKKGFAHQQSPFTRLDSPQTEDTPTPKARDGDYLHAIHQVSAHANQLNDSNEASLDWWEGKEQGEVSFCQACEVIAKTHQQLLNKQPITLLARYIKPDTLDLLHDTQTPEDTAALLIDAAGLKKNKQEGLTHKVGYFNHADRRAELIQLLATASRQTTEAIQALSPSEPDEPTSEIEPAKEPDTQHRSVATQANRLNRSNML